MTQRFVTMPESRPHRHSRESGNPVRAGEPCTCALGSRFRGNDGAFVVFESTGTVRNHLFTRSETSVVQEGIVGEANPTTTATRGVIGNVR
jgi:hypothetical protein